MAPISELDTLPDGQLLYIDAEGTLQKVGVHASCKDKKIVIFGVPGAFTPTCSLKHVPGFLERGPELKQLGVAHIFCIAVNDPFVVKEWAKTYEANRGTIQFLADGSAIYTKALGLEFDLTDKGLGMRSRRYALFVDNLVVKKANIEEGGKFEVSTADEILKAVMSCF
ncbi:protein MpPRX2 [Marchantia polymorpha subsp. ruderalis]|uniref:Glutaredoxin-dependent peroxiredoxin n=2 Tax=Marchantia polymorpha TaxID=3197 RepID=A0A176VRM6_MARPO|nr:hypothetical protein AXG93_2717s1120 [Marchantia polymorpha subsp. ruderalis]PTQ30839.1 hypothetical protein MARPO_0119s0039 [Marchantia polymorpha]BBN08873.1 hypothetical protein Mp_4g15150 [Marchantia polymorpha subsp. ruderalis]|eukprot:PTQ30839.1 hypothetical protein MARPO_0119s0039 [Marchantia polymorpha]